MVSRQGGTWTIENPCNSIIWLMPSMERLAAKAGVQEVMYHACVVGGAKQTIQKLPGTVPHLDTLALKRDGTREHESWGLVGCRWATTLEAESPPPFCDALAKVLWTHHSGIVTPPPCSGKPPKIPRDREL